MSFMKVPKVLKKTVEAIHPDPNKEDEIAKKNQDNNRVHGITINDILKGIDFTMNRIENPEDPDFLTAMKVMRDTLVKKLSVENTLSDDLSIIDGKLEYLASAWSEAVKEGRYGKAKWAMTAVNKGVKDFRTNVPGDQSHRKEEVLKERADKIDIYISLVKNSAIIDSSEQQITAAKVQIAKHKEKLDPIREEIVAARQDPEKMKILAKIKAVQLGRIKITALNDEEATLLAKYEEGVSLAKSIGLLRRNIEKARVDLNNARNLFNANYASLTLQDHPEMPELIASYRVVLNNTVKATEAALVYANTVREDYLAYTKQMDALWESIEGKNILTDVIDFINENLMGGNEEDVVNIAAAMKEEVEANEQQQHNHDDRLNELFKESNVNSNKNINYNT